MSGKKYIKVGLMGLGVIGSGVARVLIDKEYALAEKLGCPLILKKALDCDTSKKVSSNIPDEIFTTDVNHILKDPEIDIVIELIGGDTTANGYIKEEL